MAGITARHLIEHLERSGFVVMKKPPGTPPRAGERGHGQNATERAMRQGILSTLSNLAQLYGEAMTMHRVVVRLRCRICSGPVRSCFLETGPELAQRARMRRVSLIGREGGREER